MAGRSPNIPNEFTKISLKFFSLGQDADFYENLYKLNSNLRIQILEGLNDIVNNQDLFTSVIREGK